jgi:hypothetical protein
VYVEIIHGNQRDRNSEAQVATRIDCRDGDFSQESFPGRIGVAVNSGFQPPPQAETWSTSDTSFPLLNSIPVTIFASYVSVPKENSKLTTSKKDESKF